MSVKILLAVLLAGGCVARPPNVRDALVAGHQAEVDTFSKRVLAGQASITAEMLDDDRPVSRTVIVRFERGTETTQYGVDLVSDYFMCLLEARAKRSTREVLAISPVDSRCVSEDACEVCNSLTYPLPRQVRDALRQYWRAHLGG
jgi:hypothetical protein